MMHERWTTVPTDFDEARRFATEYEIEAEHAIEAQSLETAPATEPLSPAIERFLEAQRRLDGPRAKVAAHTDTKGIGVKVSIKTARLEWSFELRGGEPYELPASVVERFAGAPIPEPMPVIVYQVVLKRPPGCRPLP